MYREIEILTLMQKYNLLSNLEKEIIIYLFNKDCKCKGYSDFARIIGTSQGNVGSNIRKALLHLEQLGIVGMDYNKNKPTYICLRCDWLDNLLREDKT